MDVGYSTRAAAGGVQAEISVDHEVAVTVEGAPAAVVEALLGAAEQLRREHLEVGAASESTTDPTTDPTTGPTLEPLADQAAARQALEDAADAAEGMAADDRGARSDREA